MLVLSATFAEPKEQPDLASQRIVIELAALILLIITLVLSLFLLRKLVGKSGDKAQPKRMP